MVNGTFYLNSKTKIGNWYEHAVQHRELYLMHHGDLNKRGIQEGGDMCICIADSFCYAVEANTIL